MEVESVAEKLEKLGVMYKNYIGDGDSKTYSGILKAAPYGDQEVVKKECIGKLTGKMIDKLTVYYGLAIRRNCDSIKKMYNAIWATYYHYCSTDEKPQLAE